MASIASTAQSARQTSGIIITDVILQRTIRNSDFVIVEDEIIVKERPSFIIVEDDVLFRQ